MNIMLPPIKEFVKIVDSYLPEKGSVLEIGCSRGESTIYYAPIVKNRNGRVFVIDWFNGNTEAHMGPHAYNPNDHDNVKNDFLYNVRLCGVNSIITVIDKKSDEAVHDERIKNELFDIIFIDGGHTKQVIYNDIINYRSRVKPGGIFCGHDYNQKEVKLSVNELLTDVVLIQDRGMNTQEADLWMVKM